MFLVSPLPGHPLRWAESRASLEGENWVAQTSLQQQQRLLWSLKGTLILSFSISTDVCISPSPSQDRLGLASALAHIPKRGSDQPSPAISGFREHFCPALFSGANATIQRFAAAQSAQGGSGRPSQCPTCCHSCLLLGCFRQASGWTSEPGEGVWGICREADPAGWVGSCGREWDTGFMFQLSSSEALWPEECCPPSWSETAY